MLGAPPVPHQPVAEASGSSEGEVHSCLQRTAPVIGETREASVGPAGKGGEGDWQEKEQAHGHTFQGTLLPRQPPLGTGGQTGAITQ